MCKELSYSHYDRMIECLASIFLCEGIQEITLFCWYVIQYFHIFVKFDICCNNAELHICPLFYLIHYIFCIFQDKLQEKPVLNCPVNCLTMFDILISLLLSMYLYRIQKCAQYRVYTIRQNKELEILSLGTKTVSVTK